MAIFEVLSRGHPPYRRRRKKKDAYLTIPSLCVYALIDQESAAVVLHRRTEQGFVREVYTGHRKRSCPSPRSKRNCPWPRSTTGSVLAGSDGRGGCEGCPK